MSVIRSVLWIGSSDTLSDRGVVDAPTLDVTWVRNVDEAFSLSPSSFEVVVLAGEDPAPLVGALRQLRRAPKFPPVLVCLPELAAASMCDLLRIGAADVLIAPEPPDPAGLCAELLERIDRIAEEARSHMLTEPTLFPNIIGQSAAMRTVFALAERARNSTATVLLTGETGTGKEGIARALHEAGPRRRRPFIAINCAAFPDSLLESELFGHVKGAFTGADREKAGLFEIANEGTIFLDEIGETSGPLQAKLLRVLQEREVRPVGGLRMRNIDVRVIAATNRPMQTDAARGGFRMDLYYRLAVFPIAIPPLRERPDDIVPLAEHFLRLHGRREHKAGCTLSLAATHLLLAHRWPGNVRELENEMQRTLALADPGQQITPKLLSDRVTGILEPIGATLCPGETLRESLARIETWLIRRALERNDNRRAATARVLGVTREGLYKKMQRLKIE